MECLLQWTPGQPESDFNDSSNFWDYIMTNSIQRFSEVLSLMSHLPGVFINLSLLASDNPGASVGLAAGAGVGAATGDGGGWRWCGGGDRGRCRGGG